MAFVEPITKYKNVCRVHTEVAPNVEICKKKKIGTQWKKSQIILNKIVILIW